jgi:hypothetical protein
MRSRSIFLLPTVLLLLASSPGAEGQNLLTNPGFDTNLSGWIPFTTFTTLSWSSLDARGKSNSGSVLVTNTLQGGIGAAGPVQCVPVTGGTYYHFGGSVRIPSGQANTGDAQLRLVWFPGQGCTGSIFNRQATSSSTAIFNQWVTLTGYDVAPGGAVSAQIKTYLEKNQTTGSFQGYFDDYNVAPSAPTVLTVPASASVHGVNGAFFHTDLWILNRSYKSTQSVVLSFHCYSGQSCPSSVHTFNLEPRQSYSLADVVGNVFRAPETAGAIEIAFDPGLGNVSATSRTYTPSLPAPTNGTAIPALTADAARTRSIHLGLGNNGGDRSAGFRSNAGAYNPSTSPTLVTFTLYDETGSEIGSPITRTWAANEAYQLNDVFALAGAGQAVTTNAVLVVVSGTPVFSYMTVVDNQTGDSMFSSGTEDEAN